MMDSFGQNASMTMLNRTYNNGFREENSLSVDSPSQLDETAATNAKDGHDEYCKDVRCIEMEESTEENAVESGVNGDALSQNAISPELNENREGIHAGNISNYGALEQRLNDVQRTIDSLTTHPNEPSPESTASENTSNFRNFKLSRSRSCKDNALNGLSSLGFEEAENREATPLSEFEKGFSGRPEGVRRFLPLNYNEGIPRLSRNDSQSSIGTTSIAPSIGPNGDENITSVQTFVAEMKEMASAYEKQLAGKVRFSFIW